jgi:eukaryotic translation initiation factor 2C
LEVEYQVLKAPTLYYGKNNEHVHKNGSWNLTGRQFQNPLTMPEWGCIWIQNTQLTDSSESDMVSVLQQINQAMNLHGLKGYRMHLPNKFRDTPRMSEYDGDGISEALKDYSNKKVKLVIVIAGKKLQLSTYSALKSLADIKLGLHMACVVPRFRKDGKGPQEDMFSNLVAKINLKLGGATHILYNGSEARENRNAKRGVWVGTMFVGIDTSHPSVGSADDAPTIAAVVANYHDNCVQWPASIRRQQGKKEIVADMKQMMKERLAKWKAMNGQRDPQRIVVYRDGVSEGQYQEVLRTELVGMQGAVGETCSTAVPITLMIATKRHHTRFFLKGEAKGNPDPGTVVDSGITLDTVWDFFLQSHSSPLGTAKSTRYVIIHHDTGNQSLSATKVQEIVSYNLLVVFCPR